MRLECDSEDGGLLLSYSHTAPPMMGMSCAVENQSLDDQVTPLSLEYTVSDVPMHLVQCFTAFNPRSQLTHFPLYVHVSIKLGLKSG